jgi:geranylgeranyl pyrophosphate synthase
VTQKADQCREAGAKGRALRWRCWPAAPRAAVPAAVAVELVHNFSLLHDDVMEGDRMRRNKPSAWVVFGTGDAVLAPAIQVITSVCSPAGELAGRWLAEMIVQVCRGGPRISRWNGEVR